MIRHEIEISRRAIIAGVSIKTQVINFIRGLGYTTLYGTVVNYESAERLATVYVFEPTIKDLLFIKFKKPKPDWMFRRELLMEKFNLGGNHAHL